MVMVGREATTALAAGGRGGALLGGGASASRAASLQAKQHTTHPLCMKICTGKTDMPLASRAGSLQVTVTELLDAVQFL
jgi:hypothetical protein